MCHPERDAAKVFSAPAFGALAARVEGLAFGSTAIFETRSRDGVATGNEISWWNKPRASPYRQPLSGGSVFGPGRKPWVKWNNILSRGAATPLATQSLYVLRKMAGPGSALSR